MREYRISHKVDFPFPCSSKLWECADLEQWMEFARQYEPLVSSSARERIVIQDSSGASGGSGSGEVKNRTIEIDPFQASLVFSQTLPNTVDMEDKMEVFVDKVAGKAATAVDDDGCKSDTTSYIRFLYHALLAAKHVPLQALVTVHGESWLFNRKVSEAEFRAAKERLRVWTGETEEMHRALWHAVHVLRYAVDQDSRSQTQTSAKDPLPLLPHANASESAAAGPLTMLQANWILYICTLICWTYENRTSLNNSPLSTDTVTATDSLPSAPISLRGYISVILSSSSSSSSSCASFPSLREFLDYHRQDNNNDKTSPYNLTTILAHMRQTIINNAGGSLSGCGLLNEAGRVLMRLEEAGRQQHNQYLQQQHHQQQQQLSYQHRHLHQRRRQFQHHHHSQHPQTYNTSQIQHLHEHYIPPQHIPTTTTTSITATTTTSTLQHQPAWEFIDSEF